LSKGRKRPWVPSFKTGELIETNCTVFGHKRRRRRALQRLMANRYQMKRDGRIVNEVQQARDEVALRRLDREMEKLMIRLRKWLNDDYAVHHSDVVDASDLFGADQEENHAATAR